MRLIDIIDPEDLRKVERSAPGGWCQAWCGQKTAPSLVLCPRCSQAHFGRAVANVEFGDWIRERRLEMAGGILEGMMNCLWPEWT